MSSAAETKSESSAHADTLKELATGLKELQETIGDVLSNLKSKKLIRCEFSLEAALGSIEAMINACEKPMRSNERVADKQQ